MTTQRVYVSYSHDPPENAQFVRELADRLRIVGFEAWLDQEQVPDPSDFERRIREAIDESIHGLFIVTRRWLDRARTRTELKLFSELPPETHRRVAVRREEISIRDLQPHLQHLHVVRWLPDDNEPDARFWEVYCGLSNRPPGPRDRWAAQGRALLSRKVEAERRSTDPRPVAPTTIETGPAWIACPSRPSVALPGRDGTFLLTESGVCLRLNDETPGGQSLPALEDWSAAVVEPGGGLIVGLYSAMTAILKDGDWVYRATDAPVLALATSREHLIIGGSDGSVVFCDRRGDVAGAATIGEPVVDLILHDQGVAALGGRGAVVRLGPPDAGVVPNEPVACPRSLGTVVGLFSAGHPGRFGACSAERMATIDALTGRVTVGLHAFADGINRVLPLARGGKRLSYAVVTDAGALWLVDAELKEARPVQLPGGSVEVVGVYPDGAGGLLAWTSRGSLFAVGREPSVRKYPTADVCLAFADAEIPDRLSVIRWVAERGLQIVPLRSDMER